MQFLKKPVEISEYRACRTNKSHQQANS